MRILFLTRRFYPEVGGVEKHVLKISELLIKKGHQISVLAEKSPETYSKFKQSTSQSDKLMGEAENIKCYRINVGKEDFFKKFRVWKEILRYRKLIKESDVIHCHDIFFWILPFKLIYPKKKFFITFHGYEGNNSPNSRAILAHKIWEKLASGNICVGDFFRKWYKTDPDFVIYGAAEESNNFINSSTKRKNGLFIGRLEEETGILEYLKALKVLKEKNINLKLTVLGDGAQLDEAQSYSIKNKLNVDFRGFVTEVEKYIPNYDFIFTSRYLGILEALSFNKPVFAVYNKEIKKDYLEMTPFREWISIAKDASEIANQLETIDYENFENKRTEIKNWIRKQSWDNVVDTYSKLWKA